MKKLLIFNLKMNPSSLREAQKFADLTQNYAEKNSNKIEIIIAPPDIYLVSLVGLHGRKREFTPVKFAAQNCFWENSGAYTGEISPAMLKSSGAEYVIIGHSERRKYLGETDEMINKKVLAALKAGLKVVLCAGERKKGIKEAKGFIKKQLEKDLKGIENCLPSGGLPRGEKLKIGNLAIAYEPVWAISTTNGAKACLPEYALEMIKSIKQVLKAKSYQLSAKVLYGGSVNGKNILDFVKYKEIDGVLVGGASLNPDEVKKIIEKVG